MIINLSEETVKTVITACEIRLQNARLHENYNDKEVRKLVKQAIKETEEAKAIFEELLKEA